MRNLLFTLLLATLVACNTNNSPTAPTPDTSNLGGSEHGSQPNVPTTPPNTAGDTSDAPNQAYGELEIDGTYGRCLQETNYPLNYLSVFKVLDGGAQTRIALYKDGEGTLPCGIPIQADCTVNTPDPTARPNTYALYDAFIGTLTCFTPPQEPKCTKNCDPEPPCQGDECDPPVCNPPLTSLAGDDVCTWNFDTCQFDCIPFCEVYPDDESCQPECEDEDPGPIDSCTNECDTQQLFSEATDECGGIAPQNFTVDNESCTYECNEEPECETPEFGTYGPLGNPLGNPTAECGYFDSTPGDAGFYIAKCGQSTYIVSDNPGDVCPDEPGLGHSHTTSCVCLVD